MYSLTLTSICFQGDLEVLSRACSGETLHAVEASALHGQKYHLHFSWKQRTRMSACLVQYVYCLGCYVDRVRGLIQE